jgi:hypothetical protein
MIKGTFLNNFGFTKGTNLNMYNTYQQCRGTSLIPPGMNLRRFGGKLYAIDPKSPLLIRDFVTTLSRGTTVRGLSRVASKIGLRFKNSKAETKALICDALQARKITEPVLLGILKQSFKKSVNMSNLNKSISSNLNKSVLNNRNVSNLNKSISSNLNKSVLNNRNGNFKIKMNSLPQHSNEEEDEPSQSFHPKVASPISSSSQSLNSLRNRLNALANKV